jgi:predicted transcriptional regulator
MRSLSTKSEPKELLDTASEVVKFLRTKSEAAEGLLDTATEVRRFLRPKTEPKEFFDTATDSLAAIRSRANGDTLLKAGLIAGGVAALTAGSAAVSSFRRRTETRS